MTIIEKREKLYELALKILAEEKINKDNRLKAAEIMGKIKQKFEDELAKLEINDEHFGSMLSASIKMQSNPEIVRPDGSQGYYYSEIPKEIKDETEKIEKNEAKSEESERQKERLLYEYFTNWLLEQGYNANDTSTNRSMGKWGNPDVTGIKIITDYGMNEIEVTTIEVKVSGVRWEYDIFEAVAHRRFANLSFFAFAVDEDSISSYSRNSKLAYYCSVYDIGVLVMSLSGDLYQKLIKGKLRAGEITEDQYDIIEIYPPTYHQVRLDYKREYLESIGLEKNHKMYSWGKSPIAQ